MFIFGVKHVTGRGREFFKFESAKRELNLYLINFIDENACSHLCFVPNYIDEHIFLVVENVHTVMIAKINCVRIICG